jgi:aryl-alcohol dehydrogenase-like predicted oxidoreductase
MLTKIAIGAANFTQPYGVLSDGHAISEVDLESIFKVAEANNINAYDTAFAYGDLLSVFKKKARLKNLEITTKFSALDDYDNVLKRIKKDNESSCNACYGLLIHDPQNLKKIQKNKINKFFDEVKKEGLVKKVGVSVYDFDDLQSFKEIRHPDLVQVPLNPLNQAFLDAEFASYVESQNIEVHGRSLFLQGILLLDKLPEKLKGLEPFWIVFTEARKTYQSHLESLLTWAFSQKLVDKWVLGISSPNNLLEIVNCAQNIISKPSFQFELLKTIKHPLSDPRNWKTQ